MSVKLFTPACSLCSIILCHSLKLKKKTLSLQNYSFVLFAGLQAKALCSSFMHGHTPTHTHSSSGTICDRGTLITTLGNKVRRDGHIGPGGQVCEGKRGVFREITLCFMTHTEKKHTFKLTGFICATFPYCCQIYS